MRHALVAAGWLILSLAGAAQAFEVEARRRFGPPAPAPAVLVLSTTGLRHPLAWLLLFVYAIPEPGVAKKNKKLCI